MAARHYCRDTHISLFEKAVDLYVIDLSFEINKLSDTDHVLVTLVKAVSLTAIQCVNIRPVISILYCYWLYIDTRHP